MAKKLIGLALRCFVKLSTSAPRLFGLVFSISPIFPFLFGMMNGRRDEWENGRKGEEEKKHIVHLKQRFMSLHIANLHFSIR